MGAAFVINKHNACTRRGADAMEITAVGGLNSAQAADVGQPIPGMEGRFTFLRSNVDLASPLQHLIHHGDTVCTHICTDEE